MSSASATSKRRAGVLVRAAFEATDEGGGALPLRGVQRPAARQRSATKDRLSALIGYKLTDLLGLRKFA